MTPSAREARIRAREIVSRKGIMHPPVPVEAIAQGYNIEVQYVPLDDELSGMAFIRGDRRVIVVNSSHHTNRQRFTLAHELAHHILDEEYLRQGVHVDKAILHRDSLSSKGADKRERMANAFASEILMPTPLIEPLLRRGLDFHDHTVIQEIARTFQVSAAALQFRLYLPRDDLQRELGL